MYFWIENTLKNNHYHTLKQHPVSRSDLPFNSWMLIYPWVTLACMDIKVKWEKDDETWFNSNNLGLQYC
jgi:hypothetical protein